MRAIPRYVLAAALIVLLGKLALALWTYGTNDIASFWYFRREYQDWGAKGLYLYESEFNHPPFIIRWLVGLSWLQQRSGIEPWFWVRLPSILADVGSLFLVAKLLEPHLGDRNARLGLLILAAAPVSILVSGFHGNNDPVMIFFVLLSIVLLDRGAPAWTAGLALGMALNMKVVPILFLPAFVLWLPTWRRRAEFLGSAAALVVFASLPILVAEPELVARKVLGYKSAYGLWGISRILRSFDVLAPLARAFEASGRFLLAGLLLGLALWMNLRRQRKPTLYLQIGVLAFAFLAFTPGFGVQYVAWLVPWIVGVELWIALAFSLLSGLFLFVVYTFWTQAVAFEHGNADCLGAAFWSRGWTWSYADANSLGEWHGPMVIFEVACWVSVVCMFAVLVRRASRSGEDAFGR